MTSQRMTECNAYMSSTWTGMGSILDAFPVFQRSVEIGRWKFTFGLKICGVSYGGTPLNVTYDFLFSCKRSGEYVVHNQYELFRIGQ